MKRAQYSMPILFLFLSFQWCTGFHSYYSTSLRSNSTADMLLLIRSFFSFLFLGNFLNFPRISTKVILSRCWHFPLNGKKARWFTNRKLALEGRKTRKLPDFLLQQAIYFCSCSHERRKQETSGIKTATLKFSAEMTSSKRKTGTSDRNKKQKTSQS